MTCSICHREADTDFQGRELCHECAQALSDEQTAQPLDRMPEYSREDALTVAEIERCCYVSR